MAGTGGSPAPDGIACSTSADAVEVYDFVDVTLSIEEPTARNPFTDISVKGEFRGPEDAAPVAVDGFCDAAEGSLFRVRFMPRRAGRHEWSVAFRQDGFERSFDGAFEAREAGRPGLLRVDPDYPWHFLWEGTGRHYFWNGTTTYWIAAWQDDAIVESIVGRLARLKVNRIRAAMVGRVKDGSAWFEPNVVPTDEFTFILCPWVAERPDDVEDPGIDVTRVDLAFWRRYEHLLRCARERDVIVSVVFYVDGARPGTDPFGKEGAAGEDEQRYYRYAVSRLAAFANVAWDISNEYQLFRDEAWVEKMATLVKQWDPYGHPASVHGHGQYHFRTSAWSDFAMYQSWDEHGGHDFMLKNRRLQAETGRPVPQINEEYGYEDHYPQGWGESRVAPARSADDRRRLAWGMCMAGGYQTTGETADRGTGRGADTGGGWINGRGDETMTMLVGYGYMRDFFERFEWWKTEPADDLVSGRAWCLAEPGRQYAIYLLGGGTTAIRLPEDGPEGGYDVHAFNPRTGEWQELARGEKLTHDQYSGPGWVSPHMPHGEDWAFLLRASQEAPTQREGT